MTVRSLDRIDEILADREKVTAAVVSAVRAALLRHKQAGNPVVGMKNGRLVWLQPEEIEV